MAERKNKIYLFLPILLGIAVAGGVFIGSRYNLLSGEAQMFGLNIGKFNKVNDVLNYVLEEYVDPVNREDLIEGSLVAVLKDLDPHSSYIPPRDLSSYNEPLEGNFDGIGIEFNIINDTIVVISPIAGGPSEALGIEAGDRIVKIEGEVVAGVGFTNKDAINLLRGARGTLVEVSISRRGTTAIIDYKILRGEIPIHSVDVAYMLEDSIGYIKINRFSANTFDEYKEAFNSLPRSKLKGMVLDLRGNPGGYLTASIKLADEFLENNRMIVYTEGKSHPHAPYYSTEQGAFKNGRLVVLIDEGAASASEIVAGALQDNDRGIIMGRRSFGKGLVQEQFNFPDGSAVRLTIARYYTPTGRCIQRSYDKGLEAYYYEIYKRYGEEGLINMDSSYFADSLRFVTPGGKTVYGGGGIMPDVLVRLDTAGKSNYLRKILNQGLIRMFAFDYTDKNRKQLSEIKDLAAFDRIIKVDKKLLEEFQEFAYSKGVAVDEPGFKVSEHLIIQRIKVLIAKNLFGNMGLYPVLNRTDKDVLTAIKYINQKEHSPLANMVP
ncbi:MAG TPA: S41 family peptidase [Flavobacteriales bacterium]|nr:S41 family peptidase [Flavobacteriales bacterium]